MKKTNGIWFAFSAALFLIPLYVVVHKFFHALFLGDFCAYSAISRALFEGKNPFPDHFDVLFFQEESWGTTVPIVYPGQMLFFVIPGYLWRGMTQALYFFLNIGIVFFLLGLTFVKACGYRFRDLWMPGKKQFFYALSCCLFFLSCGTRDTLTWGQIPIILAFCFYLMFWIGDRGCFWLRTVLFAFIAIAKYSMLPVIAPLLFFKGHWKLCIASFSLFVLLSISPAFCGNNLVDVYTEYSKAVAMTVQPGGVNHYGTRQICMCHLELFKSPVVVYSLKALMVCVILWLFFREYKKKSLSDTLLLLSFSLTMLINYHRIYDIAFFYPLFVIRLFDFAGKRQWWFFGITLLFPLILCIPRPVLYYDIPAYMGGVFQNCGDVIYLDGNPYGKPLLPILPFYMTALALWSLYLYLHVKDPYRFEIPIPEKTVRKNGSSNHSQNENGVVT